MSRSFVLRTSRWGWDRFEALRGTPSPRPLLSDVDLKAVIGHSSPSLLLSLQNQVEVGDQGAPPKAVAAALRIILRATVRATPFGYSSTSTLGSVGVTDHINAGADSCIRWNSVAGGAALAERIGLLKRRLKESREAIVKLNPTLFQIGNRVRFLKSDWLHTGAYTYHESILDGQESKIVIASSRPKSIAQLIDCDGQQMGFDAADVDRALESGLLLFDLALPIHDRDGSSFLASYLEENHSHLNAEHAAIVYGSSSSTKEARSSRNDVGAPNELVDGVRHMPACILADTTIDRLRDDVHALVTKTSRVHPLHERMVGQIRAKFGDEPIPLLMLADPKYGIVIDPRSLSLNDFQSRISVYEQELTSFLVSCMATGNGSAIDLNSFQRIASDPEISRHGSILAQIRRAGRIEFSIAAISGPSGVELFARQALADEEIALWARQCSDEWDQHDIDLFDLAHIPSSDGWHAVVRPDYLGKHLSFPGAYAKGEAIDAANLFVTVEDGRAVIRDRAGKRLEPRVPSAHDMLNTENIPLYRVLAAIGTPRAVGFRWPDAFSSARRLPRVVVGETWVSPALWRLTDDDRAELTAIAGDNSALKTFLSNRGVTGDVEIGSADRFLPILGLDKWSMGIVWPTLMSPQSFLRERFSTHGTSVFDCGSKNVAEIVIPFVDERAQDRDAVVPYTLNGYRYDPSPPHLQNWISLKIYAQASDIDRTVLIGLSDLTDNLVRLGYAERWFFLRYADPEHHLRFRVRVTNKLNRSDVIELLGTYLDGLAENVLIDRWEVATYKPEVARYGGRTTLEISERIFHLDSLVAARYISGVEKGSPAISSDEDAARRRMILARYLVDKTNILYLDTNNVHQMLERWRVRYGSVVLNAQSIRRDVNSVLAENRERILLDRKSICPDVDPKYVKESNDNFRSVLAQFRVSTPHVDQERLLESLFHMFANRLHTNWSRSDELAAIFFAKRHIEYSIRRLD